MTSPLPPCPAVEHAEMASRTTFRVGGKARWLLEPRTPDEVASAVAWANAQGLPVFVMGRGSNLVVSDHGWPGAIVALSRNFRGISWTGKSATALAGTALLTLVSEAVDRGLEGIEKLAGIPGTVGGAVWVNAGAYGQEFGDRIERVLSCTHQGALIERTRVECAFGYRTSRFHGIDEIILEATVVLEPGDREALRESVRTTQEARRSKQPLDLPNAGSLFKRPPGGFASRMVEEAGLKGFRIGGAAISEKHAGFAVNLGQATASEVWSLSEEVIARVEASHGVRLEREVVFLGQFP